MAQAKLSQQAGVTVNPNTNNSGSTLSRAAQEA